MMWYKFICDGELVHEMDCYYYAPEMHLDTIDIDDMVDIFNKPYRVTSVRMVDNTKYILLKRSVK